MVILHTFLALLVGFATLAMLMMAMTWLLKLLTPKWAAEEGNSPLKRGFDYAFVNLGYSFLAAAGGGYVTAWAAAANPLIHTLALALIVLALAALSVLQSRGEHPAWYQLTLLAITPLGVLVGGLVRLKAAGVLQGAF